MRRLDVLELLAATEEARPHDAADRQPAGEAEDEDHRVLAAPEDDGDGDGQDDVGDGEEDVGDAHDQRVGDRRRRSRRRRRATSPMISAIDGGDDADLQRDPGAVDHPAEHVAADACRCRTSARPTGGCRKSPVTRSRDRRTGAISGAKIATSTRKTMKTSPTMASLLRLNRRQTSLPERAGRAEVGDVGDVLGGPRARWSGRSPGRCECSCVAPLPRRMRGSNQAYERSTTG